MHESSIEGKGFRQMGGVDVYEYYKALYDNAVKCKNRGMALYYKAILDGLDAFS